jgi:hypothetical protein
MRNVAVWAFAGLPICFYIVVRDVFYLIKIFSMHRGCRESLNIFDGIEEKEISDDIRLIAY